MGTTETLPFQAETRQLLDIVVHSLYSNKDIFLRELLSNASDALDKLKLEALEKHELLEQDPVLDIELVPDPQARTLTVSDSGIGMGRAAQKERQSRPTWSTRITSLQVQRTMSQSQSQP